MFDPLCRKLVRAIDNAHNDCVNCVRLVLFALNVLQISYKSDKYDITLILMVDSWINGCLLPVPMIVPLLSGMLET